MNTIEITTQENSVADPVTAVIFTAADFANGAFDGSPFDVTNEEALTKTHQLIKDGYLSFNNIGCYDYARWNVTFGENKDQTCILGPGDGIVFTDNNYFCISYVGIKMLLNRV